MKESFSYFSRTWSRTFNDRAGRIARKHPHKLQLPHSIKCMHSPLYALLWALTYTKHERCSRDSVWCTWAVHVQHNCFLSSFTLLLCFQTQWQRIYMCAQATLHVHIWLLAFHLLLHLILTDEQGTGSLIEVTLFKTNNAKRTVPPPKKLEYKSTFFPLVCNSYNNNKSTTIILRISSNVSKVLSKTAAKILGFIFHRSDLQLLLIASTARILELEAWPKLYKIAGRSVKDNLGSITMLSLNYLQEVLVASTKDQSFLVPLQPREK